ncbi:hypothetical protein [Rhodanobacter ginsengiterrae]|uniref:hypothetical protein n=1 Tax=Rhodanobacter ginsengiterrae TaxID=2008451 RepID=UPI003CEE8AD4
MSSRICAFAFFAVLGLCISPPSNAQANNDAAILTSPSDGLTFLSVDGKPLKSPQAEISVLPGRHHLVMGVRIGWVSAKGRESKVIPAPLEQFFKSTHHYSFHAKLDNTGKLSLKVIDETMVSNGA